MLQVKIQDESIYLKQCIDKNISDFLKSRNLYELSTDELVEFNNMLTYFNNILSDKIELQKDKLETLKNTIQRKLIALKSNK